MRPFGRRTGGRLARVSAFAVLALALVVSGAGPASAGGDNGRPDSTGNNGTLKVLEYGSTEATNNNEPHVCAFRIEGFNFDPGQNLVIQFQAQAPTKDVVPPEPNWYPVQADANGYFNTAAYGWFNGDGETAWTAGHYKVIALGKDTGSGPWTVLDKAKSKVFWVSCGVPAGDTGTVTVTKELADGSHADVGQTFSVTVTCEKHEKVVYTHTFDLKVGEPATTDPLPVGTKCTVSEIPLDGWNTPTFEPSATVTVKKGDTAVTVVNSRTSEPPEGKTGTVKVTKVLAAGSLNAGDQEFPMTVTCEKAGYSETFKFDLKVGDSWERKELPDGADCTVSEAVPNGWNKPTYNPPSGQVTVVKHTTVEITVVNSRTVTPPPNPSPTPWATLTLDKASPQTAAVLGEPVTYNLTVTADGNVSQTNVRVSDPIPAGTTYLATSAKCVDNRTPCTVTEPTASDPTVYWALGTMAPYETVTVTFQVTVSSTLTPNTEITNVGYVKSDQASAKDELVLPTAKVAGEVIVGPTTPTTVTPAAVEGETLAATGAGVPIGYLIGTGIGLIALGALLMALTRRSRSA